jgi:hypothetical protein
MKLMMHFMERIVAIASILLLIPGAINAQIKDRKNVISVNITNPLIFGKSYIFGYERMIGNNQSFSVRLGTFSIPSFLNVNISDSVKLLNEERGVGPHFGVDYRFYFKKLNTHHAPRGVYIGPYYNFSSIGNKLVWQLDNNAAQGAIETKVHLRIHTLGAQVGYQFGIGQRMTIDMVMIAPGLGFYQVKAEVLSESDLNKNSILFKAIKKALEAKFPASNLVLDDGYFEETGRLKTTNIGLRAAVSVGFRF